MVRPQREPVSRFHPEIRVSSVEQWRAFVRHGRPACIRWVVQCAPRQRVSQSINYPMNNKLNEVLIAMTQLLCQFTDSHKPHTSKHTQYEARMEDQSRRRKGQQYCHQQYMPKRTVTLNE